MFMLKYRTLRHRSVQAWTSSARTVLGLTAATLTLLTPAALHAQVQGCTIPDTLPTPHKEGPTEKEPKRIMPISGYTLAISWSPAFCTGAGNFGGDFQCDSRNGNFGFTLHGLWPDGAGKSWPQYCRPASVLPKKILRQNICVTPSAQLLQHEWAKHGTCMTRRPEDYFNRSRAMYLKLGFPDMRALTKDGPVSVGELSSAFAAATPGLRSSMLRVTGHAGYLSEVWICLDRQYRYTSCPMGSGGLPSHAKLRVRF